jgi:hypothetical protein
MANQACCEECHREPVEGSDDVAIGAPVKKSHLISKHNACH